MQGSKACVADVGVSALVEQEKREWNWAPHLRDQQRCITVGREALLARSSIDRSANGVSGPYLGLRFDVDVHARGYQEPCALRIALPGCKVQRGESLLGMS